MNKSGIVFDISPMRKEDKEDIIRKTRKMKEEESGLSVANNIKKARFEKWRIVRII